MEPRNVFLSWTGADRNAKNTIKSYLEKRGITCLDSEETCVGDFLEWSLEAARMDGVFLLILSKNISSESVVREEVAEALKMPDAGKRILIVCDDFKIYETFMEGALAQRKLSAITAKFIKEDGDTPGTVYLEDKLEEIANKVEIAMASMSFNVYRENRYPKSISLYVDEDMKAVSFEKLYLDRVITEIENGEEKEKIESPKELLETDGLYFIYGSGGSGKSLYIDQICREAGNTLVVKLSCADVAESKEPIYNQMYREVKKHMGGRGYFTDDNFKAMLRGHRLFLVLDGMDELPTKSSRELFLKEVKDFCEENHKDVGVLFTSRSEKDAESVSFGSIRVFRMDMLTEEEIYRLGKNVFLEMKSQRDQDTFFVQVSNLTDEIRCNPLLLTQLAVIYGNGEEIPKDMVGIFDKVKNIILRTPANVTPPLKELREENIGGLLKRFSYEKYNHSQVADEKVFAYILRNKYQDNAKEMAKICLKYLKERSIYVEGKFLHKMLLEYFTAVSYYEAIFDDFDDFIGGDKLKELFSHYSDLYWADMIRLFLIKADNSAEDEALEKLYEEILKDDITEYTLLLETATKLLKRKNIPTEAVCLDILKKSASGEYPAYGPLFWYVPEYELFEALARATERMKGDPKALSLTRDVCVLNGKYTLSEVTASVDGEKLFASGKDGLIGTRLALCELFYTGQTNEKGEEVYPRLFDLAETKALLTGGCGICGRREKIFSDELGLYTPLELPLLGNEYIGFLTLPNDKEVAEAELEKHPCIKVRAVAFISTEKESFGYINFYRRNVKHLYLPENVLVLEKYWDNFLICENKVFCGDKGILYRALNRKTYIVPRGVTKIGDSMFENDETVTEIDLPEGLKEIGRNAFYACDSLAEIHLPEGLKIIGDFSFACCSSLAKINLPEGLQKIGDSSFYACDSLTEIHLPDGLQEIGNQAFASSDSLTKIHLPEGLQKIGLGAFSDCSNLTEIHLPEGLQKIENFSFEKCYSLAEINLPKGINEIGSEAFASCRSLAKIHLPEGLKKIEESVFEGCSSLTEIRLPSGLQEIGVKAFSACSSLTEIYLPDGLQKLGANAFDGCSSLTKISLPFYLDLVGLSSDVQIEVREKKKEANRSEITSYSFPEGIEKIEDGYFQGSKNLLEVRLPESLKEIGAYSFEGCENLAKIHLPEGLQKIGESAFKGCSSLTEIRLSDGLTEIGKNAFSDCGRLTEIHLPEKLQKLAACFFNGCWSLTEIHLPEGLKAIGESSFFGCNSLTEINLPDGLTEIGAKAFSGCSDLKKIHLPDGLQKIGKSAFYECNSLAEIHLPEGIQRIEDFSFLGCSNLSEICLPKGLKEIGWSAFEGCCSLTKIHLPDGLTKIEWSAFAYCFSLTEINLPDGLTEIGQGTFECCSRLAEIYLPDGIKEIEFEAFKDCTLLQHIHIPKSVMAIGDEAFINCTSLQRVVIPRNFETDIERIFGGINREIIEFMD